MEDGKAKKILVVDDDEHQLVMLSDYLEFKNYEVIRARSGREGLKKLEADAPDLVLLDVMMAGMDGGDVAQAIRRDSRFDLLPIIFMTAAVSRDADSHRGRRSGIS
ncbi:MAG: response regulator [Lentisphaerae bacterium]|nr:response regulator [Lentisphaerota bacterium]